MSRTLVRYTIPLDSSAQPAHRLGINSLAIDPSNSGTLYSAGRDGIVAAWDLKMDLTTGPSRYDDERDEVQVDAVRGDASYKRSIQAHTHWVNQIAISTDYQSIYSCSSDTLVRCWRPNAFSNDKAETIGSHGDYVKALVVPKSMTDSVATAGLDRTIILWDTSVGAERLRIDSKSIDGGMKQSVYSLAAGPNILASGGIEKVIRVWDIRTGARVSKLIGHVDNVRALMCSEDGRYMISGSSDTTIKVWDMNAGRCLHTLTTHSDPVWALLSDHPQLAVFHAADKSGLVTKTDLRPQSGDGDSSESVAICKESTGINGLAQIGDHLYTATAASSIHRWRDFETPPTDPFADVDDEAPLGRIDSFTSAMSGNRQNGVHRAHSMQHRVRPSKFVLGATSKPIQNGLPVNTENESRRVSLWSHASTVSLANDDERHLSASIESVPILRQTPESVIEGQAGLQAHTMLPDRQKVLTRDSQGSVKLWDIIRCKMVRDYGKTDMDEVETQLQSASAVGSWCSVNTRVGALTVEMDPRNLLDAEVYFDSVDSDTTLDFDTKNQRFNLGKWMLQGLFRGVIQAEKARDDAERQKTKSRRPGRLNLGDLSSTRMEDSALETPRATKTPSFGSKNPYALAMSTPGASIGLATPAPTYNPKPNGNHQAQGSVSSLTSAKDTVNSPTTPGDYFSSPHGTKSPDATPMANESQTPGNGGLKTPGGSSLMKNMKWLRSNKATKTEKKVTSTASAPASAVSSPTLPVESEAPTTFREFVDRRRKDFIEAQAKIQDPLMTQDTGTSWLQPLEAMPPLDVPSNVGLSLANFQPGEGEAKDIYRGTVGSLGEDHEQVSTLLPVWLAQILLANEVPPQMANIEANKHYFSFLPHASTSLPDPFNSVPGTPMRLGAARSLRIRKALTYISQRLASEIVQREGEGRNEEEWLEITVAGTSVDPDWTLMMTRRHLWKQGGDMKLEYKLKRE